MNIKVGCDLVQVSRFKNLDEQVRRKLFHPAEWKNKTPETLAGIFAVKESCKKVFNNLQWLEMEVKKKRNGKPFLLLNLVNPNNPGKNNLDKDNLDTKILSSDVSISHDGGYALAVVVFVLENKKIRKKVNKKESPGE